MTTKLTHSLSAIFASGTRLSFHQASAPTGWTQDVSDNADNRMFRVVKTAGGGVGGSNSPILNNVVPSHTHGITTGTESADHSHSGTTGGISANHTHGFTDMHYSEVNGPYDYGNSLAGSNQGNDYDNNAFGLGNSTGTVSSDHNHGFSTGGRSAAHTHSGTTDNGSSQTNWTPRYIDMIICSKD